MNKKTVTGRTPSRPELQSLPGTPTQELAREFVEKFRQRYPAVRQVAMCPELAAPYGINAGADTIGSAEQFFIDVLTGKRAPAAKGRWGAASGQLQNIPRGTLVDADYAKLERRVAASPAFAAPYGQTNKDNADE